MLKDKFKKLRETAGLSQQEVATKAGLSWSLVAQIEQGKKSDVRVSTLLGLARALGVDAGVLLAAFAEASEAVAGGDGVVSDELVRKEAKRKGRKGKGGRNNSRGN